MDSHSVLRKLQEEHNTVDQLKELRQPVIKQLEDAKNCLGEDGFKAFEEKRNNDHLFSCVEYTEEEEAYKELERTIETYDEAIQHRENLDLALLNPNEFQGFVDREASLGDTNYFKPVRSRIALFPPYAQFFDGLKKLRQQMGRDEITAEQAFEEAQALEKEAGLKGVVLNEGDDRNRVKALLKQMQTDVDYLKGRKGFSTGHDSDDRAEYHDQIHKFFIPIRNGLFSEPISPVEVDFRRAVDAVISAASSAVLGREPEFHQKAERPSITTARSVLGQMASNSPELRRAVEAFLETSEQELRDKGNMVFKRREPESSSAGPAKKGGPGGS